MTPYKELRGERINHFITKLTLVVASYALKTPFLTFFFGASSIITFIAIFEPEEK